MTPEERLAKVRAILLGDSNLPRELALLANLRTLARSYRQEHSWADDDDPSATRDILYTIEYDFSQLESILREA